MMTDRERAMLAALKVAERELAASLDLDPRLGLSTTLRVVRIVIAKTEAEEAHGVH